MKLEINKDKLLEACERAIPYWEAEVARRRDEAVAEAREQKTFWSKRRLYSDKEIEAAMQWPFNGPSHEDALYQIAHQFAVSFEREQLSLVRSIKRRAQSPMVKNVWLEPHELGMVEKKLTAED